MPFSSHAQEYVGQELDITAAEQLFVPDVQMRGRVTAIVSEGTEDIAGMSRAYQDLKVEITSGDEQGHMLEMRHGSVIDLTQAKKVKVGDEVVINKSQIADETTYFIIDFYRVPTLMWILAIFAIAIIILGRMQGLTSLIGLGLSVIVIIYYTLPQLIKGSSPELTTLITAYTIAFVSMILAHGFKKRTRIAILSTFMTLTIAVALTYVILIIAKLSGVGSEEAYSLQLGPLKDIDLRGLFFGGVIIGTLGVLDDITTAQAATVEEISKANPALNIRELYQRGFSVGKEHIASLVNTLFLAYAGASLPLFLIFTVNAAQPFWVTLNSEFIAEEFVRTIIGSTALILAVPITTVLSAKFLRNTTGEVIHDHSHGHSIHKILR